MSMIYVIVVMLTAISSTPGLAQMRLTETGGGTDLFSIQAPAAITSSYTLTMPADVGSANQCLATDGAGTLRWRPTSTKGYALDAVDGAPVNALYVAADGHVGIGDTNPSADVLYANGQFGTLDSTFIGTGTGQFVEIDMQSGTASYLSIRDGGQEIMRVATGTSPGAGNVGIGTTNPQAKLEIRGELRTTSAAGVARHWGRGRPGSARYGTSGVESGLCTNGGVNFGLSYSTTNWNTAETVCPLGTWVCTLAERGTAACNTTRPDTTVDGVQCNGTIVDYPTAGHYGWVANPGGYPSSAYVVTEDAITADTIQPCNNMPVWCCN